MPEITLPEIGEKNWGTELNAAITQVNTAVDAIPTDLVTVEDLPDLIQNKADAATVYNKTDSDARYAPVAGTAIVIQHGTDPNVSRGGSTGTRIWVGSVYPLNSLPNDVWDVATQKAVEPQITWYANYRADLIASPDLTAMTTWSDTSGNARHLTQTTVSRKPVFHVANAGVPAYLNFTGSSAMQTAAFATPLTQAYTIIMTVRMTTVTTSASVVKRVIDGLDATNFLNVQQRGDGTNPKWQISAGTTLSATAPATTGWAVVTIVVNGSSTKVRINGVENTGQAGAGSLGGITLGSKYDFSGNFADFDATDIRVAAGALTVSQIANVEAALANSIGVVLP